MDDYASRAGMCESARRKQRRQQAVPASRICIFKGLGGRGLTCSAPLQSRKNEAVVFDLYNALIYARFCFCIQAEICVFHMKESALPAKENSFAFCVLFKKATLSSVSSRVNLTMFSRFTTFEMWWKKISYALTHFHRFTCISYFLAHIVSSLVANSPHRKF